MCMQTLPMIMRATGAKLFSWVAGDADEKQLSEYEKPHVERIHQTHNYFNLIVFHYIFIL